MQNGSGGSGLGVLLALALALRLVSYLLTLRVATFASFALAFVLVFAFAFPFRALTAAFAAFPFLLALAGALLGRGLPCSGFLDCAPAQGGEEAIFCNNL